MITRMRIPTIQYGYIEFESDEENSAEEVVKKYNEIVEMYKETQKLTLDNF